MNSQISSDSQPQEREGDCAKHGAFRSRMLVAAVPDFGIREHWSPCPDCTREAKEKREAEEENRRQAQRAMQVARMLEHSGIPARFAGKSLESYRATNDGQKRALKTCKAYAERWLNVAKKGASLVLTGGPGTGKTHLACAIAEAVIQEHLTAARFTTVSEMIRAIKSTYRKDSEADESEVIASFAYQPDLLVMDEVGVQIGSDHEKLLMFDVLNARYSELRPTILISNLSATDLETYLGHRLMDRFRECGSVVAFDWESHRNGSNQT